ncbi:hypothetical protein ACJMK2_029965 [Sinanodonta woodiana]|uniref:Uncharacterized protein n=1 Tax=Sinanodonta woodiana TaxID=1069815 RepID=A0ABD3XCB3_SINWO
MVIQALFCQACFNYVACLIKSAFIIGQVSHMHDAGVKLLLDVPPLLCSLYERPDRDILHKIFLAVSHDSQCSSGFEWQCGSSKQLMMERCFSLP